MTDDSLTDQFVSYAIVGGAAAVAVVGGVCILLTAYLLVWGTGAVFLGFVAPEVPPRGAYIDGTVQSAVVLGAPEVAAAGLCGLAVVTVVLALVGMVLTDGAERLGAWWRHLVRGGGEKP